MNERAKFAAGRPVVLRGGTVLTMADRRDVLSRADVLERGDVHTVLVNGRVVKHEHRLVGIDLTAARRAAENTVDHLRSSMGEEQWLKGMNPDIVETSILDNPYTYTDYRSSSTHSR